MCIFFCFSNTNLSHIMSCKIFTESIVKLYFVECNFFVPDCFIIICKAYISEVQFLCTCKSLEFIITECSGDLSCPVRTEVEEYNRIFILNSCNWFTVFFDNSRKYKFVCLVVIVRSLYCCNRICSLNAFSFCKSLICELYTIPAVISVHCIITSGDHTNFANTDLVHLVYKLLNKIFTGSRWCITSVQEAVYINLFKTFSLCHFKKCIEMCIVAVYTTIREKSHEMDSRIVFFCIFHCCKKCFILKEISIVDLFGDSGKFLIYDTSCTHIHMSDFGVAHLSVRKTYGKSAGISLHKRILCH